MEEILREPPTLQDVARALGLHKSTVSLALSGKGNVCAATRERVRAAAEDLGYEPNPLAQQLARGLRSDMVPLFTGVLDVGLATVKILAIQQALSTRGLDVPVYIEARRSGERDRQAHQAHQVHQLRRQRPRALICAAHQVGPAVFTELEAYQKEGGIVVTYDAPVPLECDQVRFDRERNTYDAARYLLDRGHRRLGIGISSGAGLLGGLAGQPVQHRLRGFRRALAEFGLVMRDEWFFQNAAYERGGAEMAARFLAMRERPTALCIVNDYVALAFTVEVMRAGLRVPADVSVVSHDNREIAAYCPVPLTSVTQPANEIASSVVDLLLDRLEGRLPPNTPPRTVTLSGEVVERASVAPCPGA